ncbi:MAG: peptide-methionine (S)-S-oxide reductase [Alphaproteobacteria bacterium HGW-Alphaproteobacteria-6]|nr:MAG: peptide-methionine (S)-S-oxide reductase [Alphaproteobacteria bacterium HGW-Alphaproteobacteria-6]
MRILTLALLAGAALTFAAGAARAATETAIFAGGCFWCVEADFERVDGVISAVSGFTGGSMENPTYAAVSAGGTGHYESVRITFDPARIGYDKLIWAFFRSINPTDAGGQFCDRGDSYRTAVFVTGPEQRRLAEAAKAAAAADLGKAIVTPILDAVRFHEAEEYHQDFYKSTKIILTRFGPRQKATAYKLYRADCGRDRRVLELWGENAPFAH